MSASARALALALALPLRGEEWHGVAWCGVAAWRGVAWRVTTNTTFDHRQKAGKKRGWDIPGKMTRCVAWPWR